MRYKRLLEERRSCRSFREESIESEIIAELFTYGHGIKSLDKSIKTQFIYIDKGFQKASIFSNKVGYNGFIVSAPYYVALVSDEKNNYLRNAGYMMEEFLLKTVEFGLASCWLTLSVEEELKEKLGIQASGKLVAMAAIGYPKSPLPYTPKDTTYRESIESYVYMSSWDNKPKQEELELRGLLEIFLHLRKAPSWKNHQPWRFLILEDEVLLCVGGEKANKTSLEIDAGIMMLYMENIFKETGINPVWREGIDFTRYKECSIPAEYNLIAAIKI